MSYHDLTKESGGSADDRISEARRILAILKDADADLFIPSERKFIEQMHGANFCSTKQLFWLRDIKDKYL